MIYYMPVGLAFPHCHRLSGSKFTKNLMVLFIPPYSTSAMDWTFHCLFADFRFSLTLNPPLVVCRFPLQLYFEPSTGRLQLSNSSKHCTLHWLFADFHSSYTLNLPLVVCSILLQLNTEPSTGFLQISASAKHSPPAGVYNTPKIESCTSCVGIVFPHWNQLDLKTRQNLQILASTSGN